MRNPGLVLPERVLKRNPKGLKVNKTNGGPIWVQGNPLDRPPRFYFCVQGWIVPCPIWAPGSPLGRAPRILRNGWDSTAINRAALLTGVRGQQKLTKPANLAAQ